MTPSSRTKRAHAKPAKAEPRQASRAGLSRENRTLRMVGLCNQALLRAGDEAGLVESICRITVEKGGYRMAWVGYAEEKDGAKIVRPVAHAGFAKDFLNKLNLTWDGSRRGLGPTGTAIKTGKPSFISNVQKDPRVALWRKDAVQQGFASLVSLPLSDKEKVFGALILYSSEPDDFSETEISLLNQLAGDLAFGIRALRAADEHAELEAEMRRSEAKFRSLIEHSYDLITVMDKDARRIYESPSLERTLGFKPGERADWGYEANPPEDRDKARELIQRALAGPGVPVQGHLKVLRKDGRCLEMDLILTNLLGDPAVRGIVINSRDVTERMLASESLARSEQKYRELVENANSIILRWTRDGRLTFLNEFGQKFFGYRAEEVLGRNVMGTIVPETESGGRDLARLMDQILADPASFEQNTNENMRRNGERVWIAWTNKIVKDEAGRISEILSIGTDITARKRAEDEVRELNASLEERVKDRTADLAVAKDRAEAADRLKSAFLATMSHELRTPLNSIIGFTGILLQQLAGPLNPEQQKQLGMVQESARHLLSLINDVLDISKIEAGQLEVQKESFDLGDSLDKAAGLIRPLAEKKGLALGLETGPEVGRMTGDPRRVEQVVINLLNNAVKFTARGSVTLGAGVEDGRVKVWVADTGMGIKEEDLGKLFKPFQQIDAGLTRQHEGTGLGLAICKRLAELMGGDIQVESEWGRGSRFTLVLPWEQG